MSTPNPPEKPIEVEEGEEGAIFAAGCYWGVEHVFKKYFKDKGLKKAQVGFIGGKKQNPTYEEVCNKGTGHAEAVFFVYDPKLVTYRQLVEFFYRTHEPTTLNKQGNDKGDQYRSAIFYMSPEQERIAREVTDKVNKLWFHGKVTTEIAKAGTWWPSNKDDQDYLIKNPWGYQCPTHYLRNESVFPALE